MTVGKQKKTRHGSNDGLRRQKSPASLGQVMANHVKESEHSTLMVSRCSSKAALIHTTHKRGQEGVLGELEEAKLMT